MSYSNYHSSRVQASVQLMNTTMETQINAIEDRSEQQKIIIKKLLNGASTDSKTAEYVEMIKNNIDKNDASLESLRTRLYNSGLSELKEEYSPITSLFLYKDSFATPLGRFFKYEIVC